ncbi:MAG TPA: cell wall-binding repeat-containing protein [Microbacterium sp.]|nr:cell wall-binding repeat-containing protein [Microbacterium sp.]
MSSSPESAAHSRARIRPLLVALLATIAVVAGLLAPAFAAPAQAADLTKFDPGNIISDGVFFNKASMTQAQIQSFLVSKEGGCQTGYTCLKDYTAPTRTIDPGQMCNGYTGAASETAAAIVFKVAQSCGINPQVFLVMLQKEQGLVLGTHPSTWNYNYAMGANCPDSTGCNGDSAGFFTQVYSAGWQLKRYANPPGTSQYFDWYPIGGDSYVQYNPKSSCGSEKITIANQATADLYYYTPYVPNAAALAAGYGAGDACSSYGNRNFYNYFTDWFGSTQVQAFITTPLPTIAGTAVAGQILTARTGTWSPAPTRFAYQWLRNGTAVTGATTSTYKVTNSDAGQTLSVRVTGSRLYYRTVTQTSAVTAAVTGIPTARLSGTNAYQRANAASRAAHSGTVSTVYLVGGTAQQDSLSVAALAAARGAGFLLVPASSLPPSIAAELKRLAPTSVVLVGTTATLDSGTATRVKAVLPKATVSRITGADRFARSLSVAARFGSAPTVYLATGWAYPDAISGAAVAGGRKAPLIVVPGTATTAPSALLTRLKALHTTKVVVLGGTAAVSSGLVSSITKAGIAATRYSGGNLYYTNSAVMSASFTSAVPRAVAVSSAGYGDGPAAAALAGTLGAPLLMTARTCIPSTMAGFFLRHGTNLVTLAGGTDTIDANSARLLRC